jgi:hypothetical protein
MNTTICHVLAAVVCITHLQAQPSAPEPAQPEAVRYTLGDGDSTVTVPKNWMIGKKDEKNLVAWISSDKGRGHTHRIYRLAKSEVKEGSAQAHADALYADLTTGDQIMHDTGWKMGESQGGRACRRMAHLMSDVSGDAAKEDVWLVVEAKEFADRVYLQVVYHQAPLEQEMLKLIDLVLNSVQPKPSSEPDGAAKPSH